MTGVRTFLLNVTAPQTATWWTLANTPASTWVKIAGGASFSGAAWQKGATVWNAGQSAGLSPSTGIYSYGGATPDSDGKRMFLFGGGHTDYHGNETYALNLNQPIPAWELFKGRSPGCTLSVTNYMGNNGAGQFQADIGANAWPISHHNSASVVAGGKLHTPQMWGGWTASGGSITSTSRRFYLDLDSREWAAPAYTLAAGETTPILWEGNAVVALPWLNQVWGGFSTSSRAALYRINATTGELIDRFPESATLGMQKGEFCSVPPRNGRPGFVVGVGALNNAQGKIVLFDTDTPAGTRPNSYGFLYATYPTTIPVTRPGGGTGSGSVDGLWFGYYPASPYTNPRGQGSLVYWPQGDCLFYVNVELSYNALGVSVIESFIKIAIPSGATTMAQLASSPWVCSRFDPANQGQGPASASGGSASSFTYKDFSIIENMGDGDACLVLTKHAGTFANFSTAPVYVMRLRN